MTAQYLASIQDCGVQHPKRAILELRRGLPIVVQADESQYLVIPVEGLQPAMLDDALQGAQDQAMLLLSPHRLTYLAADDGTLPSECPAALPLATGDDCDTVIRWAVDPAASWPAGRFSRPMGDAATAVMTLLRRGFLIPAAVMVAPDAALHHVIDQKLDDGTLLSVTAGAVAQYQQANHDSLHRVSEAQVPLEIVQSSRFIVFREADGLREHVAVLVYPEQHWPDAVPVRLHSACLTGDLFGSLRCDCGSQLKTSVETIRQKGGGVLLYLDQEGRSIGFANKMRAYQMQDDGLDTLDADQVLGFGQDERDYQVAREMLCQLNIARIELLTNNPAKMASLDQAPIKVEKRSNLYGRLHERNRSYLATKARRAGHWLDLLLEAPADGGQRGRSSLDKHDADHES